MAEKAGPWPPRWFRRHRDHALLCLGLIAGLAGPGLTVAIAAAAAPPAERPPAEQTIPLASAAGQELLLRRESRRADYGALAQWLETQAHLSYCGVASSVMVLNSLGLAAPLAEGLKPYRFWTQINVFSGAAARAPVVSAALVSRQGMTLAQLDGLLTSQGARVRRYYGEVLSLEHFRWLLKRNLADPDDRLLVNYDRRALGQSGGGHISPLAAYDPRSDRVLILDVARYRYPAVWVTIPDLWQAVRSVDRGTGRSRGLLTIEAAAPPRGTSPPPDPS